MSGSRSKILIVDDDEISRRILGMAVEDIGYSPVLATGAEEGWERLRNDPELSIVCVDWVMPGVDGTEFCRRVKHRITDRHVYTIMVSGQRCSKDDLVHAMAAGADDFITKPIHAGELVSRLFAGKRVLNYEAALREETAKSDRLLNSVLPEPIAARLKRGETNISDFVNECSIMFIDICDFTAWCMRVNVRQLIEEMSTLFAVFDARIKACGAEKIKSIGDAYMIVAGLPVPQPDHAFLLAELALEIHADVSKLKRAGDIPWAVRTGIASGPAVAGVISAERFIYDVWGPTVNLASRLESHAPRNGILVNNMHRELLGNRIQTEAFGAIQPKGFDEQDAWLLKS